MVLNRCGKCFETFTKQSGDEYQGWQEQENQYAQLPILVIAIVMPIIATLPEYRPSIDWKRRVLELVFLISILPLALFFSDIIPVSLIVVITLLPLLIKFEHSVDEEE